MTRPEYVTERDIERAAEVFVGALGTANADFLRANLNWTIVCSDGLRALNNALTRDFNDTRQEEIRDRQRTR